jgi:hypothetical protein
VLGIENVMPTIIYIRLECSVDTAISRKSSDLEIGRIRAEHNRQIDNVAGELIFNTDALLLGEVVNEIHKILKVK